MVDEELIKEILNALEKTPGEIKVVAIDGRCASGKTTLAEHLARASGAGVIHMDDFFLPEQLRTARRMEEAGGNVHYERFEREVLPRLKSGEAFAYRRFDCGRMEPGEAVQVGPGRLRIVEGAYSCHPRFGSYMNLRVFGDITAPEQRNRIRERNGEEGLKNFLEKWIPLEERYFAAFQIREHADFVTGQGER